MKALDGMYPFCPEVHLFHSRKKMLRWCEEKTGVPIQLNDGADAQTAYFDGVAVVLFEVEDEPVWENALLVHESYHVVIRHLEEIGEDDAGEEIMAYMLQCVSGSLMNAHEKWRKKHASDMEGQQLGMH